MTIVHKPKLKILTAAIAGLMAANLHAGGFSLYGEGNGLNAGNYAAGSAAEAVDASIGWYNPAGLALLKGTQFVAAGTGILVNSTFNGTTGVGFAATGPFATFSTIRDYGFGENAFIPTFHMSHSIGENATLGFSVTTPFGLSTDWKVASPARYAATRSELVTMNFSPQLGARVHENFAIGMGIDVQYAKVKFNRVLGTPVPGGGPGPLDSASDNRGHSVGVGFHAGILGMYNDNHTRIGLNYQSEMRHKFHGRSILTGPLAGATGTFRSDSLASNNVKFPSVTTLSVYHDIDSQWAVLGSVVYTGWDVFKTLTLNNAAIGVPNPGPLPPPFLNALASSSSVQNYNNAWRFALGANYVVNEQWKVRFGGGFDETPTNNVDRDIRLPDADRWALSIGGTYVPRPDLVLDFGWTHLFISGSGGTVNKSDTLGGGVFFNVNGKAEGHADLLAIQGTWKLDQPVPTK